MANVATCALCGEPMPAGEEMFKFHGYKRAVPEAAATEAGTGQSPRRHAPRDMAQRARPECRTDRAADSVRGFGLYGGEAGQWLTSLKR